MKDSEQGDGEGVEVGGRGAVLEVEGAAEELHPKEGEDQDEEEEQEQQRDDRPHRAQQRDDQVSKRGPVPASKKTN